MSAICVPVASSTTILGTLWIFGSEIRDYSDQEINIVEIIAGRIAAELENVALQNKRFSTDSNEQTAEPESRIECHPVIDPPFAGWVMEGQCGSDQEKFIDWDVTDDEEIRLTVGIVNSDGSRKAASVFIDPLTADFQVHGRVSGVSFWLVDHKSESLVEIDEWANRQPLKANQSLLAATTDDPVAAEQLLANLESGVSSSGLILCLSRN